MKLTQIAPNPPTNTDTTVFLSCLQKMDFVRADARQNIFTKQDE